MHGLPVMEQEVGAVAGCEVGSGSEECSTALAQADSGLGGTGPVLKTQTIVSIVLWVDNAFVLRHIICGCTG